MSLKQLFIKLSQPEDIYRVNAKSALEVSDITQAVLANVPDSVRQTKEIAPYFLRNTEKKTCIAIWEFLWNELEYREDGPVQIVKLPAKLLRKPGDCKSFALFTAGILINLGIPAHFKLVWFSQNEPQSSHIYVVTESGWIIDGTFDKPLEENKAIWRFKNINYMNQVMTIGAQVGAIDFKKTLDEIVDKIFNSKLGKIQQNKFRVLLKGVMRPGRYVFLVAIQENYMGLATALKMCDSDTFSKIKTIWYTIGGEVSVLMTAMNLGYKKPRQKGWPVIKALVEFKSNLDKWYKVGITPALAAGIAEGATIVASTYVILKPVIDDIYEKATDNSGNNNNDQTGDDEGFLENDENGNGNDKTLMYIAAGVLVFVLLK